MDEIQKILVKAGRPDLAQKYYLKVAEKGDDEESPEMKDYRKLLMKLKDKKGLSRLKLVLDSPRTRKPDRWWYTSLDSGTGEGSVDVADAMKKVKKIITMGLPAASILKKLLSYGVSNGPIALNRILANGRVKITLGKE